MVYTGSERGEFIQVRLSLSVRHSVAGASQEYIEERFVELDSEEKAVKKNYK